MRIIKKLKNKLRTRWQQLLAKKPEWIWYFLRKMLHPKAVFLILTPEHDNLGDHAIAKAETTVLRELGISFIEIPGKRLESMRKARKLKLMDGRPIFVNGGGNLGTLWPNVEQLIQDVIRSNPHSPILIFPSTSYYEDQESGQQAMRKSADVYNGHEKLLVYAREQMSYQLMRQVYHHVKIAPDMVLRLNESQSHTKRNGCILCLRSDREKTLSQSETKAVEAAVLAAFGASVQWLDMERPYAIPISRRERELEKQFSAFRHAELVITDRLHGMLFAVITGTPCIVLNSKSPKVYGCYSWISDYPFIQICDDVDQILQIYQSIPRKDWQYDASKLAPMYEELKTDLLRFSRKEQYADN